MAPTRTNPAKPLPRGVIIAGSGVIVFHLFAVLVFVLSAQSGPWITPFGPSQAFGPYFLDEINRATSRYLDVIHLAHDYHFQSNHTDMSAVYFEAILRDNAGNEIATVKFPNDKANFWVRHRHGLLALGLANDRPVEGSRGSNPIAAPGKQLDKVAVWAPIDKKRLEDDLKEGEITKEDFHRLLDHLKPGENYRLAKMKRNKITLEMDLRGPSSRTALLAKSYARYLGRLHHAASVELIRYSRDQVMPEAVFLRMSPDNPMVARSLNNMVANFGVEALADEK